VFLTCACVSLESAKLLPHSSQLYGFSPVWVLMCILRWYALLNDFGQCLQVKGSSLFLLFLQSFEDCATDLQISLSSTLCWTLRCCLRLDDCEKALSQRSHWYGRSPEWVRLCRSRQLDSGFSPVWVRWCMSLESVVPCCIRPSGCALLLLRRSHLWGLSPLCELLCSLS
uniref:Uncharacterized protein n=1 Tax=Periophthalmus magnuspinnatus TaxID=409849 RepID=A0A3B3ZNQ6_9GOBI